jgi:hypothetical protein
MVSPMKSKREKPQKKSKSDYSEFFYSGNPKLNIVLSEDFLSCSVAAQKDREEIEEAKRRDSAFRKDRPSNKETF